MPRSLLVDRLDRMRRERALEEGESLLERLDRLREQEAMKAGRRPLEEEGPSLIDRAIPMALRVGGSIGGGLAGGLVSSPSIVGIPAAVIAGGMAGSGLGEAGAEAYEKWTGQREEFNPWQIATQTALGAYAPGRIAGATIKQLMARRAAQGALMGGGSTVATELAESGELPSAGNVAMGAGLGTVLGAVGGRLEGGALRRRVPLPTRPPVREPVLLGAGEELPPQLALPPGVVENRALPAGRRVDDVIEAEILTGRRLPPGSFTATEGGAIATPDDAAILRAAEEAAGVRPRELGPGPRFVAGEGGDVVDVQAPTRARAPKPQAPVDPSGVRTLSKLAVSEWDYDLGTTAREGVRPRSFSTELGAADVPHVTAEERRVLEHLRDEAISFPSDPHGMTIEGTRPGELISRRTPGSPAVADVLSIANTRQGTGDVVEAIDALLAGKPPTNRLQVALVVAARDQAETLRAGQPIPASRRPVRPIEQWEEETRLRAEQSAADAAAAKADEEGFEAFSREVDELAEPESRLSSAAGFARTPALAPVAGGALGAAYGGATGEDSQDRLERALLFGGIGAAGGGIAPFMLKGLDEVAVPGVVAGEARPVGRQPQVPRTGVMGSEIPDPMANTDRFLGKFDPVVAQGIKERLVENNGFEAQRRGTIPVAQLGKVAERIAVDVSKALPKGTAVSGEVVTAYARAAQATQQKIDALAAKVAGGSATDTDLVALAAARADGDVVLQSLMGLRAEAGRSLATFRYLDSLVQSGRVDLVRDAADKVRREMQAFATEFRGLEGGPLEKYQWLQQQGRATGWDKVRSYFYANILSGPKTHARNIGGNISSLTAGVAAHPFAAGWDAIKSAATGKPREVFLGELGEGARAAYQGIDQNFSDLLYTLKNGVSPQALQKSLKLAQEGTLDLPRTEFGGLRIGGQQLTGAGGNPFNWPGRGLDAVDVFFRGIATNAEAAQGAYAIARKEGLSGEPMQQRIAELKAGRTAEGAELAETVQKNAARAVFQEKGGKVVSTLAQLYQTPGLGKLMTVVAPFLRTPANILRRGAEYSPAGFAMKHARQGGREGTRGQGAAAMGTAAAGFLAYLAYTGRLSGNGPRDPQERATLMESGWRPNSVKLGDTWVNYQAFAPISVQASIVANLMDTARDQDWDEKEYSDAALNVIARSANSFLDQSFLGGIGDFIEAVRDPERSVGKMAGRTAQGFIPFIGAQRSVRDVLDPTIRKPKGMVEEIVASLPGVSERIEPRLSTTGEPVTREGGAFRRALDPTNAASVIRDPVNAELRRLGIELSPLRDIDMPKGGRELTKEESFALRQRQGRQALEAAQRVMRRPVYQRMTDEQKIEALQDAQQAARARVNKSMRLRLRRPA